MARNAIRNCVLTVEDERARNELRGHGVQERVKQNPKLFLCWGASCLLLSGFYVHKALYQRLAHQSQQPLFLHLFVLWPPRLIATAQVRLSEPFAVDSLNGVVEARGGKLLANVHGVCEGTGTFFEGDLPLEKPVMPTAMAGSGYLVLGWFLLSTQPECKLLELQSAMDKEISSAK